MSAFFCASSDGRPVLDLRREARSRLPELSDLSDLSDLPALTDEERAMAARTWRGRMVNEHVSAQVFASLVPQAMRAAVPNAALSSIPQMISDELRHAEQCAGVVLALGHDPIAPLPPIEPVPAHEDAGPLEAFLRNVVSVGCVSETIAVSIIRAEQAELEGSSLGKVLSSILADEIQHARFGWSMLGLLGPRLDAEARERLDLYLIDALRHQMRYELPKLPVHLGLRGEIARAGVCDGLEARGLFFDTVETVIVPGLEKAGLRGASAWAEAKRLELAA